MNSAPLAGPDPVEPTGRDRFALGTWLFLRLLGLVHLAAFGSFWLQAPGLIGAHGLLPAAAYLRTAHQQIGAVAYWALPTLCWWFGSGVALHALCATGILAALLLLIGRAPTACLVVLWVCYLSLMTAAQLFLSFQWDALLLETSLFACFVAPRSWRAGWRPIDPPPVTRWLLTWLLFRLMVMSGAVKLASGDPTWRSLTALRYHFETQPLPNTVAWWAHQLPESVQRVACAAVLGIEVIVPFLLWAPRRLRHGAAWSLVALQVAIALTGNYAFFNYLTIALCLVCIDDAAWLSLARAGRRRISTIYPAPGPARPAKPWATRAAAGVVAYTLVMALPSVGVRGSWLGVFSPVIGLVAPFASLNSYGLFAVMTTSRIELIVEGSEDGQTWRAYEFPSKPSDLARQPLTVAPHQPRLDWQLWFAALGDEAESPWVRALAEHLLRGTPEVLSLLAENPFPARPPRLIRVRRCDYHFTTRDERAKSGRWWKRTDQGLFLAPVSLP